MQVGKSAEPATDSAEPVETDLSALSSDEPSPLEVDDRAADDAPDAGGAELELQDNVLPG